MSRFRQRVAGVAGVAILAGGAPAAVQAATVTAPVTFTASDGAQLRGYVSGEGGLRSRPLIVEFSPYAETSFEQQFAGPASFGRSFGPAYNYLIVNQRGTGLSTGAWTAEGPRDQQDVAEVLASACHQPWSSGHIGLYGFSASAIAIYNALHLPLACVETASLMAGTADLYRDLLYPGGIPNVAPAAAVGLSVGGLLLGSGLQPGASPPTQLQAGVGLAALSGEILSHQSEDGFWTDRTQRPNVNTFSVLADTSFYDPEARGPFESYKMLRSLGSHFMTFGAHDGYPAGTQGPFPEFQRWFDHKLLGTENGVDKDPVVQLLAGNGSREALLSGNFTRIDATDWPVPGTRWQRLFLDAARSGSAKSLNDGALTGHNSPSQSLQTYPGVASLPTATDPHTTAALGAGVDTIPPLTQMNIADPVSLTYSAVPFARATDIVGPASLDVFAAGTAAVPDLHAVFADVRPDGRAFPVGQGRLRTSYSTIVRSRSEIDANGEIVQPYGDYSTPTAAIPGEIREYHLEFWPIANHFAAGDRLRLYLVGTSGYMSSPLPGLNLISIGGATPSRLLLPVLPTGGGVAPPNGCATPGAARNPCAGAWRRKCARRRSLNIRVRALRGQRILRLTATFGRRRIVARHPERGRVAVLRLTRLPADTFRVRVLGVTNRGVRIRQTRTYLACKPRPGSRREHRRSWRPRTQPRF